MKLTSLVRKHLLSNRVAVCLYCSFVAWSFTCAICKIDSFNLSLFFDLIQHPATFPKMWNGPATTSGISGFLLCVFDILACLFGRPFLFSILGIIFNFDFGPNFGYHFCPYFWEVLQRHATDLQRREFSSYDHHSRSRAAIFLTDQRLALQESSLRTDNSLRLCGCWLEKIYREEKTAGQPWKETGWLPMENTRAVRWARCPCGTSTIYRSVLPRKAITTADQRCPKTRQISIACCFLGMEDWRKTGWSSRNQRF